MKLADLESREVLLAKLAGAMKGTMAKAARTFDALRLKLEDGVSVPVVSEPVAQTEVAEVPAEAVTEVSEVLESPAVEVVAEVTETPVAEATEEKE
jgi:large subunit ribosomal protein L10